MNPDADRSRVRAGLLCLGILGLACPAAAQKNPWSLNLGASESYHTNVRLSSQGQDAFATGLVARLARGFEGPRWQLAMSGSSQKSFYHGRSRPRPSFIFYTATAQLGFQLSESASFSLRDNFRSSFTGDFLDDTPSDADVPLPLARQKRNHARAALGLQLSALTSLNLSGSHDVSLFQQEDASAPRLTNGDRLSGGLGLSRKLSDVSSGTLNYSFAHSDQRLQTSKSHSVSLGLSRMLGEFTNAGVSIGASRRESTGRDDPNYVLNGGASLGRQFEDFSLSLSYRRDLGALFGFGREVVHNTFRLSHSSKLTRDVGISLGASHTRARDPDDPAFGFNGWFAHVGFNWAMLESVSLHTAYRFSRRTPLPDESDRKFQSHRVSLSVGWNTSF